MFDEVRDKLLDARTLYGLVWIDEAGIKCEVDDCEEDAILEVEMSGIPERASCYMHLGFAIEDSWFDKSVIKRKEILASIEKAREVVPQHLKNGGNFEYD